MMKVLFIEFLVLAVAVSALAGNVVTLDSASQLRAGIDVLPVVAQSFGAEIRVVGQVVRSPGSTLTVKSVLPGLVEKINVAPGDMIKAGMVLTEVYSHEILGMQGEFLKAGGMAQLAHRRLDAGQELFELDGISKIELQTREQEAFAAQLELDRTREELLHHGVSVEAIERLKQTRQTSDWLPVIAPLDGVVLEMMVQEHQWIQAYEPLMVVGDPERVELMLQIPPDEAARVVAGSLVEYVPVGRPHLKGKAEVISRVPQVDPETRTVRIRARLVDEKGTSAVYPGVFVEGTVATGEIRQSPSVPASAVIRMGDGDVVFVRTGPSTFEARQVDLGLFDGRRYEIRSGLEVDEDVVVQGVFSLKSVAVSGEAD